MRKTGTHPAKVEDVLHFLEGRVRRNDDVILRVTDLVRHLVQEPEQHVRLPHASLQVSISTHSETHVVCSQSPVRPKQTSVGVIRLKHASVEVSRGPTGQRLTFDWSRLCSKQPRVVEGGTMRTRTPLILYEMCFNLKNLAMKFTTRFLILLVEIMLCSKLHCQKSFKLKHISYKISRECTGGSVVERTRNRISQPGPESGPGLSHFQVKVFSNI